MNNQKKCSVFWEEPKTPGVYTLNGREGRTYTDEEKQKLSRILEECENQIITVTWEKTPLPNNNQ